MLEKEKSEIRIRLEIAALIIMGVVVVAVIIMLTRGGVDWFTDSAWSKVSVGGWIAVAVIAAVALSLQYYLLILLRFRILRHVFWLLPAIWLLHNGLLVIQRLMESEAGEALTGWLPLTDLFGWLLSAVFLPLLAGGGAVAAIIDSGSIMPIQACQAANMALNAAGIGNQDIFSRLIDHFDVFWDLLSESFRRQVAMEYATSRPFLDFGASGFFNLPYWFFNCGYYFSCITV